MRSGLPQGSDNAARPPVTDTATDGTTGGGGDGAGSCSIVSNSGNCYAAGQFCRDGDHGAVTTTADGTKITCAYRSNAWRWTYV